MNVWSFTGNLGKDAETRYTGNNDAVTSFSVAVKAGYGKNETTTWANCTVFGKRGEAVAPYLTKGAQVGISGEASLEEWTDKEGGKRVTLKVRVNDVTLLGKRSEEDRPMSQRASSKPKKDSGSIEDLSSDIPF